MKQLNILTKKLNIHLVRLKETTKTLKVHSPECYVSERRHRLPWATKLHLYLHVATLKGNIKQFKGETSEKYKQNYDT